MRSIAAATRHVVGAVAERDVEAPAAARASARAQRTSAASATPGRRPWPPAARRDGGRSRCGRCRSARTARSSGRSRARSRARRARPRAAARSRGRITSTCGLFVRSIQMRIGNSARYRCPAHARPRIDLRIARQRNLALRARRGTSRRVRADGARLGLHPDPLRGGDAVRRLRRRRPRPERLPPPHDDARDHRSPDCSGRWSARGSPTASAAAGAWSCSNATGPSCTWGPRRSSAPTAGSSATASRPSCSGA